jgi:hypothetical protein
LDGTGLDKHHVPSLEERLSLQWRRLLSGLEHALSRLTGTNVTLLKDQPLFVQVKRTYKSHQMGC